MDSISVRVGRKDSIYPVFVGDGLLDEMSSYVRKHHAARKIAVITDSTVGRIFQKALSASLGKQALEHFFIAVPAGERSKTRRKKEEVENILLEKGCGRDTLIIALGGGMVTDLAGFTAATYQRGVPVIHVPTTLLAMADASVGGKTGVNTPQGKNLIGAIWQPDAVFADLSFLETLPEGEFLSGLAEIVKIAATSDRALFSFMEQNAEKIRDGDKKALLRILTRAIALKKEVVSADEAESGLRQTLNFGHTIAHAVESCSRFRIKHGFCVSIGMAVESRIAVLTNNLGSPEEKRITALLKRLKLPVTLPLAQKEDALLNAMKSDKKSRNQKPHIVLLRKIGAIVSRGNSYSFAVDESILRKGMQMCRG